MRTRKLALACPVCGSADVFYSCTPNCCFNHVCAGCGTTFEPMTRLAGGMLRGMLPPDPPPDATDPTVECAKCGETTVSVADNGALVCTGCGALLILEITQVAPG